jgi:hypothetical protein
VRARRRSIAADRVTVEPAATSWYTLRLPRQTVEEGVDMPAIETTKTESTKATESAAANAPLVVDVGKKRRRQIKKLRNGRGKLMDQINQLVEELRTSGSISATTQPLVVVVRQRRRTRSLPWA